LGGLGLFALALHFVRPVEARPRGPADLRAAPARAALERLDALVAAGHVSPEQAAERRAQLERAWAAASAEPDAPASPPAPQRPSPPPPPRRS
jgi:hypothetical protein